MIDLSTLKSRIHGGEAWVVFRDTGEIVPTTVPAGYGPAILLVAPVTDALKTVSAEELVEASLDRDATWAVIGFALSRTVVDALEGESMSSEELYGAVREAGHDWEIHPADDLL